MDCLEGRDNGNVIIVVLAVCKSTSDDHRFHKEWNIPVKGIIDKRDVSRTNTFIPAGCTEMYVGVVREDPLISTYLLYAWQAAFRQIRKRNPPDCQFNLPQEPARWKIINLHVRNGGIDFLV